jgi:hypothetical protein
MGAISTNPRLRSVAVSNATALTAISSIVAMFAATAIARHALKTASRAKEKPMISLPELGTELNSLKERYSKKFRAQSALSELDVVKQSTLHAVSESSALVSTTSTIAAPITELLAAPSLNQALKAQSGLLEALKIGHQEAQIINFRQIATKAYHRIGFSSVEEMPGSGGQLRLVGRDRAGRTLVTEFESHYEKGESISSEVLGICHSGSDELLDDFEKALEDEGVVGLFPSRKRTGGVAQLEASRNFIRRPITKASPISQKETVRNSNEVERKRKMQNSLRNRLRQR